jgi:hypothetical protein
MSAHLTREASELGWPPGRWFNQVTVNAVTFHRRRFVYDHDGDLTRAEYDTPDGDTLVVFND